MEHEFEVGERVFTVGTFGGESGIIVGIGHDGMILVEFDGDVDNTTWFYPDELVLDD